MLGEDPGGIAWLAQVRRGQIQVGADVYICKHSTATAPILGSCQEPMAALRRPIMGEVDDPPIAFTLDVTHGHLHF